MTAYVTLRRGGFQKVADYDTVAYEDPTLYSGYYRNTGWVPNIAPIYEFTTPGPVTGTVSLLVSRMVPSTGKVTLPDEQLHTPPRALSWKETRIKFTLSGRTVAQFLWKDINGYSDQPPAV